MLPPPNRKIAVPGPHERHEDLPSVPEEKSRQQILTNCKLRTDGANDGDTVTVLTRSGEYRFSLYFVDVPDFSRGGIQQMQAYSAYFGNLSEQDLRTVAKEAQSYIASVLGHHSFDVVTRWERAPEESPDPQVITSRAFVYCEGRQGEMVNLASLLVDRGLATVCNAAEMLPDEMTSQAYLAYLQKLEQAAIANKRGAWKFSQGVAMTSSQQVMPVKYQTR